MARKPLTKGESVVRVGVSLDTKSLALYTALCPENLSAGMRAGAALIAANRVPPRTLNQEVIEVLEAFMHSYRKMGCQQEPEYKRAESMLNTFTPKKNDGECQSCVDGKCVTGDKCVTLGRD